MNTSPSESDNLGEADESLRRLIANLISPAEVSGLSDEQVEALLREPVDTSLSDDQIELIIRKAEAKIRAAGDTGAASSIPAADVRPTTASAPPSPVLGFLGGATDLSSAFTPTFWTLLVMVSGIGLTLALVIVLVVRGIHVQVDVPNGGGRVANGDRADSETERRIPEEGKSVDGKDAGAERDASAGTVSDGPVARLARVDGRWTNAHESAGPGAIRRGSRLRTGQKLDLAAGEAEVVFQTGAVAVLRGPAKIEIDSPNSVRLVIGNLSVRADTPVARGFTVHTGSASLVDLGTEFHVQAAAEGHSEVYVSVGAVEVRAQPGALPRLLNAGQAAHIETGSSGVVALIEGGRDTQDFVFPTIKPPSDRDYADASQHHASIRVVQGKLAPDSGPIELLLDGRGQSNSDAPGESVFFTNNQKGRILLDLGRAVTVREINTYSWHKYEMVPPGHPRRNSRTIQRYILYGYEGEMPPSTGGDPAANGWTLISRVNSDAFFSVLPRVEWPAQLAVSITGKEGQIGRYRYLLWEVHPTHVDAGPATTMKRSEHNTFFGELDVYAE
jgi:hypothetical protein